MLAANGERSFRLADRLRAEMEKLFSDCQGGDCPSGNELDNYLKLQRGLNPRQNFAQMARSRKFSHAGGESPSLGTGRGQGGSSGYAVQDGTPTTVLGNEPAPAHGDQASRQSSRFGQGTGRQAGHGGEGEVDKPDTLKGLNPVNRQSGAVASEVPLEEYHDFVEHYFKAITTKKNP